MDIGTMTVQQDAMSFNRSRVRKYSGFLAVIMLVYWITEPRIACALEPSFGNRTDCGIIENSDIREASGIAASRRNPGVLWTHNDSGDTSRIFALSTDGRNIGEFSLQGIDARDWEDIAVGPGPEEGVSYLYIGEIGDNLAIHSHTYIYRVPEPYVPQGGDTFITGILNEIETITVQFPDGARDAETLMVDPLTRDIYIVTKRENSVRIYRAPYPQTTNQTITLEFLSTLPLTNMNSGDISPTGEEIILKTYNKIYYWLRDPARPLMHAFDSEPVELPYIREPQGEGVCWDSEGEGYYTISEQNGNNPVHLYYYPRNHF